MKRTVSLKENYEFHRVYRKGAFKAGKWIVVYALPNHKKDLRLGISVGKKYGNSVQRSRITRLIRESYRLTEDRIREGYDIVISSKELEKSAPAKNRKVKATELPEFKDISGEMARLMKKLGLLREEAETETQ